MAAGIHFDCLSLDLGKGIHRFNTDQLNVYLSNAAPAAGNTVYGVPADLASGGGYTAGGLSLGVNAWAQVGGFASLVAGGNLLWTATTGFGPFRYAVLYNFTAAAKNLIGYWDYGQAVTITAGKTFEIDFSAQILTLNF